MTPVDSVRFDRIVIEFYIEFEGQRQMTIELGRDEQADERLLAIVSWHRERTYAAAKAAIALPEIC